MHPKTLILHQVVLLLPNEADSSLKVHPRFWELIEYVTRNRIPLYFIGCAATLRDYLPRIVKADHIIDDALGGIHDLVVHIATTKNICTKKMEYLDSDERRLRAASNAGAVTDLVVSDVLPLEKAVDMVCIGSITPRHAHQTLDKFLKSLVEPS